MILKQMLKAALPYGLVRAYSKLRDKSYTKTQKMNETKRIAFVSPNYANKYIHLMKSAILKSNYEVTDNPEDAQYVWLHWYEDVRSTDEFLQKISNIKTWKEQGRKIIYQIHNKAPHESHIPKLAKAQMTALLDMADCITIHSSETLKTIEELWDYGNNFKNVVEIPHPNYVNVYGKGLKPSGQLTDNTLKILFFGVLRPYKGIENLIDATAGLKNISISIYGMPINKEYEDELNKAVKQRMDVSIHFGYVDGKDLPKLMSECHIVALPYKTKTSLNSGVAILAFSYGRTVIGSKNGTLKDLPENLYFGYKSAEEQNDGEQLRKMIIKVQKEYRGRYNKLLDIGEKAYDFVNLNNNEKRVSAEINAMIGTVEGDVNE